MTQIFSKAPPQTPSPAAPATMPDPNSPSVTDAKRRAQLDIMSRAGRSSTILTAPDKRGGDAPYTATRLGSNA